MEKGGLKEIIDKAKEGKELIDKITGIKPSDEHYDIEEKEQKCIEHAKLRYKYQEREQSDRISVCKQKGARAHLNQLWD